MNTRPNAPRFRVARPLTHGAEGRALLVEDRTFPGGPVVAKVLDAPPDDPGVRESLRLLTGLHHPYLNPLLDLGRLAPDDGLPGDAGAWFVVSPFVPGPDLRTAAEGASFVRRVALLLRLARVLADLHAAGVLHGDLKTEHVLLTSEGDEADLRLIDLGFASRRTVADQGPTRGSFPYLAPERLLDRPVSPAAEIYAFGVTAFEVITGRLPFGSRGADAGLAARIEGQAPALARVCPTCPGSLAALVDRTLAREPEARPAGAAEVAAALHATLAAMDLAVAVAEARHLGEGLARTPFLVGRAEECARLGAALGPGRGQRVVRVTGPLGSGRTRLLREARLQARLQGRDVVSWDLAATGGEGAFDALAVRAGAAPGRGTDPVARLDAALVALARRAAARPLALLIDDAHEAPREVAAVLRLLPEAVVGDAAGADEGDVVTVVASAPDSGPDAGADAFYDETLPLGPLPAPSVGRWLARCAHEPTDALVGAVLERTGGSPRRIRALLEGIVGADPVRLASGDLPPSARTDEIPRRTGDDARLLAVASLFGAPLTAERLATLVGRPPQDAAAALARLAVEGVLVGASTPDALRLAEPLDDATVGENLGAGERRRLHEAALGLLSDAVPVEAAARVRHLAALGLGEQAVAAALALADIPAAPARAVQAALGAAAGAPGVPTARRRAVLLRLAEAHRGAGAFDAARAVLDDALAETEADGDRAPLLVALGTVLADRGVQAEAEAAFAAALLLADGDAADPAVAARALAGCAKLRLAAGAHDEVAALADEGLRRAAEGDPVRCDLLRARGMAASYRDRHDEAAADLAAALALDRKRGDRASETRSLNCSAIVSFRRGQLDEALLAYQGALAAAEAAGSHGLRPQLVLNLASLHHQRGELGRAWAGYQQCLRLARALGTAPTEVVVLCDLALLHVALGDPGEAARLASEAERRAAAGEMRFHALVARAAAGVAAAAGGHYDEAARRLREARSGFVEAGAGREATEATLQLADLEMRLGRAEAAREWVTAADVDDGDRAMRSWWLRLQGELDALGDGSQRVRALDRLERAQRLASDAGALEERFRAALALARLHRDAGQSFLATRRYAEAREDLERMAVALPEPLRATFWQTPERAEVHAATATVRAGSGGGGRLAGGGEWDGEEARGVSSGGPNDETERLYRLLELNRHILSDLSLEAVLEAAMDAAISLTGAERGFIILPERGSERGRAGARDVAEDMRVRVARNIDRERVGHAREKFSRTIAERVLESGVPLLTLSAGDDDRLDGARSVLALRLQSVACLPIRIRGEVRGVIYLDNRWQRGRFSERDERLLTAFADQVGVALENARMVAALEKQAEELRTAKEALERVSADQAAALEAQDVEVHRMKGLLRARQGARAIAERFPEIVGESEALVSVLDTVERVARADLAVLVTGESGTGKELVARALHQRSRRHRGPFLTVNCGAIPAGLLESELFGHTRGAFTGAVSAEQGLFRAAHRGTVFLDEIGDLPLSLQVKLLRALQEHTVRPVGGTADIPIDVRFVAATNRVLRDSVASGAFREDLYYRLAGVEIEVPPLRARREDIPLLVRHFLARLAGEPGFPTRDIDARALTALSRHPWPGNVRELENVLRAAVVLAEGDVIRVSDLPPEVAAGLTAGPPVGRAPVESESEFRDDEKRRILRALEANGWNRARAARALGMPRSTFYRRLREHDIATA